MSLRDFHECVNIALEVTPPPSKVENLPLLNCRNRVLAEDVFADIEIPSYPTSIKDGYAVRSSETPGQFKVHLAARAGDTQAYKLPPSTAAYVTTGSPLPIGADSVIEIEKVIPLTGAQSITIPLSVSKGNDVRQIGSDLKRGEQVLAKGLVLGPAELGILAALGRSHTQVFTKPCLGVLSSGNELIEPSSDAKTSLERGQVFDCNRVMLISAAEEFNAEVVDLSIIDDTVEAIDTKITEAIHKGCDILVTSGGVSEGDRDCIGAFLKTHGQVYFNRVNIKPGKPITFARIEREGSSLLVIALPGNPVSSLVMFNAFVLPCLKRLAGWNNVAPRSIFSTTVSDLVLDDRPEFVRATLHVDSVNGNIASTTTGMQRSSRLQSAVEADCLLRLPGAKSTPNGMLPSGSIVETIIFRDWRHSSSLARQLPQPAVLQPFLQQKQQISTESSKSTDFLDDPKAKQDYLCDIVLIGVVDDLEKFDHNLTQLFAARLATNMKHHVSGKTTTFAEVPRILRMHWPTPHVLCISGRITPNIDECLANHGRELLGLAEYLHEQDEFLFVDIRAFILNPGLVVLWLNDSKISDQSISAFARLIPLASLGARCSTVI